MSDVKKLTLDDLKSAVTGGAVAIRRTAHLAPAGGPGSIVYPSTYEGGEYATDERVVEGGKRVPCALLDSVQSQANRMELALLDAHREGKVAIPLVEVDFGKAGVPEVGAITSLDAPHRLADAILRDSTLNGVLFRKTEEGKTLDTANTRNATGLFELCPTALLLGLWDSAGPLGGLGTKFARTLVSEIVAVNVAFGARPTSRIDPLGIQLAAGPVFKASAGGITLKKENAVQEKGAPVKVGKEGKPSEANHGNVTPSLVNDKTKKPHHGGVTMDYALQSAVLSLPGLRRLRFPDADHKVSAERNVAAQTVLAALGLAAAVLSISQGCDLRSRCLLIPDPQKPAKWETVDGDGHPHEFTLNAAEACDLLNAAVAAAEKAGLKWRKEPLLLTPSEGLADLVKKSRQLAASTVEE